MSNIRDGPLLSLDLGPSRSSWPADLHALAGLCGFTSSDWSGGATPVIQHIHPSTHPSTFKLQTFSIKTQSRLFILQCKRSMKAHGCSFYVWNDVCSKRYTPTALMHNWSCLLSDTCTSRCDYPSAAPLLCLCSDLPPLLLHCRPVNIQFPANLWPATLFVNFCS